MCLVHAIGSTTEGCDRVSQPERSGGIPACPADHFRFYEGVDARSVKSGKWLRVVELHPRGCNFTDFGEIRFRLRNPDEISDF